MCTGHKEIIQMCYEIKMFLSYLTGLICLPESQNRGQEKGHHTFCKTFSVLPLIIHYASLDFNLVLFHVPVKTTNKNMYVHYPPICHATKNEIWGGERKEQNAHSKPVFPNVCSEVLVFSYAWDKVPARHNLAIMLPCSLSKINSAC